MTTAARIDRRLKGVLFALIALVLAFAPSVDSVAHAATQAVEQGHGNAVLKVISAFDIVEDVLDHLPGEPANAHHHHCHFGPAWPQSEALLDTPAAAPHAWPATGPDRHASAFPEGQDHPPRT